MTAESDSNRVTSRQPVTSSIPLETDQRRCSCRNRRTAVWIVAAVVRDDPLTSSLLRQSASGRGGILFPMPGWPEPARTARQHEESAHRDSKALVVELRR